MVAGRLGRLQSSEHCPTIRDRELKQKEVSSGHPVKSYRSHRVLRISVVNSGNEQDILSVTLSLAQKTVLELKPGADVEVPSQDNFPRLKMQVMA